MKKQFEVKNANEFFDKIIQSKEFTGEKTLDGVSLRYNEIFVALGNPKIKLEKIDDKRISVKITPNLPMIILALITAIFFWGIMFFAIINHKNIIATIISALAPTVMWVIEWGFLKGMSKIILGEFKRIDNREDKE